MFDNKNDKMISSKCITVKKIEVQKEERGCV